MLAIVGDQFADCGPDSSPTDGENGEDWPEICGCTISVRQSEDIISIWNRVDADARVKDKIK